LRLKLDTVSVCAFWSIFYSLVSFIVACFMYRSSLSFLQQFIKVKNHANRN